MNDGGAASLLLDSHALFWLVDTPARMTDDALEAVKAAQAAGALLVSPISAWKISCAAQKREGPGRMDLLGDSPGLWFRKAVRRAAARIVPTSARIAVKAAEVAAVYGRKDPGDCFLIATVRVRGVPIVTRDGAMQALARARPDYLAVVPC